MIHTFTIHITPWPVGHVASQPATTWHVTDLIKSVTPAWTPINTLIPVEINVAHSTYSSPLVKDQFRVVV
jgi:hypothetical protein